MIRSRLLAPFLLAVAACAALSACGGAAVRNREAWNKAVDVTVQREQAQAKAHQESITGLAGAAAKCTDDRCVENVAAFAAIVAASGGAGAGLAPLPAPPREASGVEKFTALAGALAPLAATVVNAGVQWHQADTSRDVSLAQYGFLQGVVHDTSAAAVAMQPSVSVGGDYTIGNGNTVARGHIGDAIGGSVVGGDQIGGDRTAVDNSGIIHTGDGDRYGSDGPWTGPICTGTTCQPSGGSGNTDNSNTPAGLKTAPTLTGDGGE